MKLNINNTFTNTLTADKIKTNNRRQVNASYSFVKPSKPLNPKLVHVAENVLELVGLKNSDSKTNQFLEVFSGKAIYKNSTPYAMCYGGHQFGNWAGQLGDGRAINLFEVKNNNKQWVVQLKGSGETPYSRNADGLAVLRSSIREYLCSEAMFNLGIPTTRALCLIESGNNVLRDVLYDGNTAYEKGAIVCRVSESFIRFGNFQLLTARNNIVELTKLVNYTVKQFYPNIKGDIKQKTIELFSQVANNTLNMIINWQRVGFVHGVMNTDNMSILGQTIDYGPYGWLEGYDFNWTPNTTDNQHKRYRFGNQANIGLWNLLQLANALFPLVNEASFFEEILENYKTNFDLKYHQMMKQKLGLFIDDKIDKRLIETLESNLHLTETDMTIFFRNLNKITKQTTFSSNLNLIKDAFYSAKELTTDKKLKWQDWLNMYVARLQSETLTDENRYVKMNKVNPKYVLRNYMAQLAIDDANNGDYKLIDELFSLLKKPYNEQPNNEKWFAKRPEWARHKIGCSKLSCSS